MKQSSSFFQNLKIIAIILSLIFCYGCSPAVISTTPTPNAAVIFTQAAQTAETRLTQTEAVITRVPENTTIALESPSPALTETPAPGTPTQSISTNTPQTSLGKGAACIPSNNPQTGKVLEILDGSTIKVMINGKTYIVKYIGIETPGYIKTIEYFGVEAKKANAALVFAKDITLIEDSSDKDPDGRLLRYIKVGDKFVNLELISKGFGKALSAPPNTSCDTTFKSAEEQANSAKIGLWKNK